MKIDNKYKRVAAILLLVLFIYGGYSLFRGANISMSSLFRPAFGAKLLMSMDGFKFTQTENGRVTWQMEALSADLYENKEARIKEIVIVFNSSDRGAVTLMGESGIMDTATGNAAVYSGSKDVRVMTSDGYLLTTNSLHWRAGERVIRTADPFKLLGSKIYLEGRGLSADVDIRRLVVNDNVKAVLQE